MKVFIDTSAFIALFVASESLHQKVSKKYKDYRKQRAQLFTSLYILDELFSRLIYDFGKSITKKVIKLLDESIEKGELLILDIDQVIFKKAQGSLIKFSEHKISLTDATSYVLYRDFALGEIFTLDSDFKKIRAVTSF